MNVESYFKIFTKAFNFYKRETLTLVFSCKFWETLKSTFFHRTPPDVISENIITKIELLVLSFLLYKARFPLVNKWRYLMTSFGRIFLSSNIAKLSLSIVTYRSTQVSEVFDKYCQNRSRCLKGFCKEDVLRNFAKFTRNHLCQTLVLMNLLALYNFSRNCIIDFWQGI